MTQAAQQLYADGGRLAPPVVTREQARSAGMTRYFTGEPCMRGHVAEKRVSDYKCVACALERSRARYADPQMRQRILEKQSAYRETKPGAREAARSRTRKWRAANKDRANLATKEWKAANPDRQKQMQARRYQKIKSDPLALFVYRTRTLISVTFRTGRWNKPKKTEALLGCTMAEFRDHIERQFLPGMGWYNMHLWDIDHIVPVSSARSRDEVEALSHATNLRPLWREQNRSKSAKLTHLI